jgi:hypothetical protein
MGGFKRPRVLTRARHSREGGNPVRFLQPNGCPSKNGGALRRKLGFWIPAFAGMTNLKIAQGREPRLIHRMEVPKNCDTRSALPGKLSFNLTVLIPDSSAPARE